MLIDTHCHLSDLSSEDLAKTLDRAKAEGVETLIAIGAGTGFEENTKTLAIANAHPFIFCALGMHPHDAKEVTEEHLNQFKTWALTEPKVRAIGEIGLDYHYLHSDALVQKKVLRDFCKLAKEVKKPIVIHDRECGFDCVSILEEENMQATGGVVHCFAGDTALAKRYLDLGFHISFTGIVTFKNAQNLRDVVKFVPLEKMFVETDSPFLAPMPFRGKPNEPSYVKYVAQTIATVKGVSYETVCQTTTQNATSFFGLPSF